MLPSLTWLDLTSRDRDKMRRVLDLFSEQGTVDEMGLGSLRDALSDALFPGTSAIQTRLRYVFFIPWIYQRLEHKRITSDRIAQEARKGTRGWPVGPRDRALHGSRFRQVVCALPPCGPSVWKFVLRTPDRAAP